jgi:acetyl esterase/lipase
MHFFFRVFIVLGLLTFIVSSSFTLSAQDRSTLSLQEIMKGYNYIGYSPENAQWNLSGDTIFFNRIDTISGLKQWYAYSTADSSTMVYNAGVFPNTFLINPSGVLHHPSNASVYFGYNGTLCRYEKIKGTEILLDLNQSIDIKGLSADGESLFLSIGLDFYTYNPMSGRLIRLNEVIKGKNPLLRKSEENYLETEELALIKYLSQKKQRKELQDSISKINPSVFYKFKFYADKSDIRPLSIDRTGNILFYILSEQVDSKNTIVPDYVRADAYTGQLNTRSKVGVSPPSEHQLLLIDLARDTHLTIDFSFLPGIFNKPFYLKDYASDAKSYNPLYDKPKPIQIYRAINSESCDWIVFDIFSLDNKDRWIVGYDIKTKSWKVFDHQHDEAWIGGPGVKFGFNTLKFIPGKPVFYYKSEESGYAHLYLYDLRNDKRQNLSSGQFEIHDIFWSTAMQSFLVSANKSNPGAYGIYRLSLEGEMAAYTNDTGKYEFIVDWSGTKIATMFSTSNTPPELFLPNENYSTWTPITQSTTRAFSAYRWQKPDVINIKASDGVMVPARIYRPEEGRSNGAAVLFVHGAGYLQNAHHYWSQYYREYMFHHFLIEKGYTVLDLDFRASSGYGRDWRTAIYRHMGKRDLDDYVDAAQYLVDSLNVDEKRIGIYGGSYGGFITLMALFKYPGKFACGAALRSVTDWAHYNHGYTSNILNTPDKDPKAFKQSSPIYYAEGLVDPLLILHGMIDTNVHFQDVVRLNQRLIELGKTNFDMALYPIEDHGFTESESWYDEYRRIFELFQKHLIKN